MPNFSISEELFEDLLEDKLEEYYPRAITVLRNYGEYWSYDITNVLLHASNHLGDVSYTISEFEKHWEEYLRFQHPELCKLTRDGSIRVYKTDTMFIEICKTLCVKTDKTTTF